VSLEVKTAVRSYSKASSLNYNVKTHNCNRSRNTY